jgi:hypothetical protein
VCMRLFVFGIGVFKKKLTLTAGRRRSWLQHPSVDYRRRAA